MQFHKALGHTEENSYKKSKTGIALNFFQLEEPLKASRESAPTCEQLNLQPMVLLIFVTFHWILAGGGGGSKQVPLNPLLCLHKWKTAPIKKKKKKKSPACAKPCVEIMNH